MHLLSDYCLYCASAPVEEVKTNYAPLEGLPLSGALAPPRLGGGGMPKGTRASDSRVVAASVKSHNVALGLSDDGVAVLVL